MLRLDENPSPWRALERDTVPGQAPAGDTQNDEDTKRENWLLCRACGARITSSDNRIAMAGQHEHHCANPHGINFLIGCFRSAPGCAAVGRATQEFTWFPGYSWRIAVCHACKAHLGWRYSGEQGYFHGLILDQLRRAN